MHHNNFSSAEKTCHKIFIKFIGRKQKQLSSWYILEFLVLIKWSLHKYWWKQSILYARDYKKPNGINLYYPTMPVFFMIQSPIISILTICSFYFQHPRKGSVSYFCL